MFLRKRLLMTKGSGVLILAFTVSSNAHQDMWPRLRKYCSGVGPLVVRIIV